MSKLSSFNCLVSIFTLLALGVTTNGYSSDFSDDKDYQRQQEQADKAFEELEKTDDLLSNKPTPVAPSPEMTTEDSTPASTPVQAPTPVSAPVVVKRAATPPVPNKVHAVKTGSGITFEFDSCIKTEGEMACHFNLTSQGDDRGILFGSSDNSVVVILDDLGNQYRFYKVKVGAQEQFNPYRFSASLAADTPTGATFSFGGISSQTQRIVKLEINSAANKTGEWEKFALEFEALPFTTR